MRNRLLGFVFLSLATSFSGYATVELTENISLSGFAATSLTHSNNETELIINRGISDETCLDCDTTVGLQLDYFNESFKASAQLVKRPQDRWDRPELEWAYLGYTIDNVELRAGRLRLPLFLASEYYYVSHAYNYARPPDELYNSILGITAYNGISAVWNLELFDEYQLSVTPFIGFGDNNAIDITPNLDVALDIDSMSGINFLLTGNNYRWNFTYFNADFGQTLEFTNAAPGVPYFEMDFPENNVELYSLGAEYEFDNLLLASEFQFNNIRNSWYASVAYRIDQFVPYIMYGENTAKMTELSAFDGKTGSSSLIGVRYDIKFNISMNLEWQKFHSFGGQRGSFVESPKERDADVYTLMFSFVF